MTASKSGERAIDATADSVPGLWKRNHGPRLLLGGDPHDPQRHSASQAVPHVHHAIGTLAPLDGHRAALVAHDVQVDHGAPAAGNQLQVRRIDFDWHWRADGRYEAERLLRSAVGLAPQNAELNNSLAVCLHTRGATAEAVVFLQRALELAPDYVEACRNLVIARLALGDTQGALRTLNEMIARRPRDVRKLERVFLLLRGPARPTFR